MSDGDLITLFKVTQTIEKLKITQQRKSVGMEKCKLDSSSYIIVC